MKKLLAIVAVGEALTGVLLLLAPQFVAQLLFEAPVAGAGAAMGRIAGILLIAIGVACWPGPALVGMLTYGTGVTLLLAYFALVEGAGGVLLWPAVALHIILTAVLARGLMSHNGKEGK